MNQLVIASIAVMILLSGCASTGGSTYAENNGGLPEIAPVEDVAIPSLEATTDTSDTAK